MGLSASAGLGCSISNSLGSLQDLKVFAKFDPADIRIEFVMKFTLSVFIGKEVGGGILNGLKLER